jgi:hypothetical protein
VEQKKLSPGEKIDQANLLIKIPSVMNLAGVLLETTPERKCIAIGSRKLL